MILTKRILLLSLSLVFSAGALAEGIFDGQWNGEQNHEDGLSQLTLLVKQTNNQLAGSYCYIARNGARIDCPDDGVENLHGSVKGQTATIFFDSGFGGKNGKATLQVAGEKMSWALVQPPRNGEYYAPQQITLTKSLEATLRKGTTKKFVTDKFTVSVTNRCGEFSTPCDDMFYLGIRKKDNEVITLKGKTVQDDKTGSVTGALFINGSVTYLVDFTKPHLEVKENAKVIVEQSGVWSH